MSTDDFTHNDVLALIEHFVCRLILYFYVFFLSFSFVYDFYIKLIIGLIIMSRVC